MAIGDPWDTSYNPRYSPPLKNKRTGEPSWMPDMSDEVSQDDPLSIKERRQGRFCTEGCGCVGSPPNAAMQDRPFFRSQEIQRTKSGS